MPQIDRRKFLIGVGTAAVAASAIAAETVAAQSPIFVSREDMGIQALVDASGNWFEAYTSALHWNGKTHFVQVDRDLVDLFPRTASMLAHETIFALEDISESESREVVLLIGNRAWSINALKEYYR